MKRVSLWVLIAAALISLNACHWNHHNNFTNGSRSGNRANSESSGLRF